MSSTANLLKGSAMKIGNSDNVRWPAEALGAFVIAATMFVGLCVAYCASIYVERGELPADILPAIRFVALAIFILGTTALLACLVYVCKKYRK